MYTLYVIPGSHACRSAMLMLEHKRLPYRRVDLVTLLHPIVARLHGFDTGDQARAAGTSRTLGLRLGDRLATVPGLASDGERVSTNHGIARFLDERHPEPPLFPAEPEHRSAVEAAERWANDTLQMAARRLLLPAALRDPSGFSRRAGDGRLGHLLYQHACTRRLALPLLGRIFSAGPAAERKLLARFPAMLDRIDAWIADGVLGQAQLNAADFMIAPSLALILYRPDVLPVFEGRPALTLVDRLLPEPASARAENVSNRGRGGSEGPE
jgi:glutathione S-transferase